MRHLGRWTIVLVAVALGFPGGRTTAAEYVVDQKNLAASDDGAGSAEKPFKTISKAIANLQPGDRVLIRAGVYRESVMVTASGTAEKPIVIEGAPDEKVVISGGEPVTGWRRLTKEGAQGNPNWEHIWVAEMEKAPDGLYQNGQAFLSTRWPAEFWPGKLPALGGGKDTIVDPNHLTQPDGFWEGGTLVLRLNKTHSSSSGPITKYDAAKHELTAKVGKGRTEDIVPEKDTYCIEAALGALAAPGEYALDLRTKPIKVYIWPQGEANPNEKPVGDPPSRPFLRHVGTGGGPPHLPQPGGVPWREERLRRR